jgi:hypothetical protein
VEHQTGISEVQKETRSKFQKMEKEKVRRKIQKKEEKMKLPWELIVFGVGIFVYCLVYCSYWLLRRIRNKVDFDLLNITLEKLDSNLHQEEVADGSWKATDEELTEPPPPKQ